MIRIPGPCIDPQAVNRRQAARGQATADLHAAKTTGQSFAVERRSLIENVCARSALW